MTYPTYNTESLHTPESRDRDARFVGHEPKGSKMTERVDLDAVRDQVMTIQTGGNVYVFAEDYAALLAERDALEADNQRLRECLDEAQNAPEPDHNCPAFRHVMDIVGTALAEQENTDDQ